MTWLGTWVPAGPSKKAAVCPFIRDSSDGNCERTHARSSISSRSEPTVLIANVSCNQYTAQCTSHPLQGLDSYRFIRKQEYFNKFMQLVGVGGCFGWSGRLYGRPIRACCWAVVLQRVDGERGCWRGARRVVCERE